MSEEIIDINTPQEILDIFFNKLLDDFFNTERIKEKYKYSNEFRLAILDVIPELIREHSDKLINFIDFAFAPVVKKVIEKKLVDWSKIPEWNGYKMSIKLILLRAEYLDLISDEDKNIIRELAEKNPNAFYELSDANKRALNDKLGTNLKYDGKFENELGNVFCKKYLSDLQSKMWSQTGDVSGGYCHAKSTYQAVHGIYDYNYWSKSDNYENILMPYVKNIKKEYPKVWDDNLSSGSGGKHPYDCLYESKRTDRPIVSFELINNEDGIYMPAALFRNGKICYYSTGSCLLDDQEYDNLDFRDLISAVLDKCPVVVGKGNHAQYLKEDIGGRKKFLRCMVEFLFSKQFLQFSNGDTLSFSCAYVTMSVDARFGTFFCELFNYGQDELKAEEKIEYKIDDALKNIKDHYSRACEKIKFGRFFCEEFIRQYIDERDKNKNLDMDPCDFLDAVLKDFVENHIDKDLFKKDETEEKPEDQPKPEEIKNPGTEPDSANNQNQISHIKETEQPDPIKSEENIVPKEKTETNQEPGPAINEKPSEPEINIDRKIDELSRTIINSNEIKNLVSKLNSVGKFAEFKNKFKERIANEAKSLYNSFECYFKDKKNNPKPDIEKIKTQLKNYFWLYYPEGKAKDEAVQQINNLDKISTWQKFLEIIKGILAFLFTFDKNKITEPKESVIFSRLKGTEETLLKQSNVQKCK